MFRLFGQFIDKHFGESFCVDIDVNDEIVFVLDVGDVFKVFTVEFDETEPDESGNVESDFLSFLIVLEDDFMEGVLIDRVEVNMFEMQIFELVNPQVRVIHDGSQRDVLLGIGLFAFQDCSVHDCFNIVQYKLIDMLLFLMILPF